MTMYSSAAVYIFFVGKKKTSIKNMEENPAETAKNEV